MSNCPDVSLFKVTSKLIPSVYQSARLTRSDAKLTQIECSAADRSCKFLRVEIGVIYHWSNLVPPALDVSADYLMERRSILIRYRLHNDNSVG